MTLAHSACLMHGFVTKLFIIVQLCKLGPISAHVNAKIILLTVLELQITPRSFDLSATFNCDFYSWSMNVDRRIQLTASAVPVCSACTAEVLKISTRSTTLLKHAALALAYSRSLSRHERADRPMRAVTVYSHILKFESWSWCRGTD